MVEENFFAIPASILTIINYSIPDIPLIKIIKNQLKIEEIPIMRLVTNYVISFFWYFYSDKISYSQNKFANKIGIYCSLAGIGIYLYYEFKINKIDSILNALIILFNSLFFYHYYDFILGNLNMFGKISMIVHLVMLLYPIYLIFLTIKHKDYNYIHFYLSLISLAASIFWFIYGEINKDFYIKTSYGTQAFLDLIQILLYHNYKRKDKQINSEMINYKLNDIKKTKSEDNNSDDNYDTAIEIEDERQKFTKYDNL